MTDSSKRNAGPKGAQEGRNAKTARAERLKAALRDNLRKRKDKARQAPGQQDSDGESSSRG
ncbi:hypothetical protein ACUJ46_00275 [Sandaracinobacteroides sp. A072]|uniref:hypothetical protein n=1 Tax=Sandaracinobacteroides sp. A072 TaxID=3461146 RepID=UPI004042B00D